MLHTKENQFIRLEYENDGSLNGFCPKARSNSLRKYPLWRAVISYNGRKEIELRPAGACAVSEDGDRIEFRFDCGEDRNGKRYPVSILCKGVHERSALYAKQRKDTNCVPLIPSGATCVWKTTA